MAQQVQTTTTDDIDGTKAVETVRFAIDGADYEIDLNRRNAKSLRKTLEEYISAGRKVRRSALAAGKASKPRRSSPAELKAIRQWAKDNGVSVADRGRISADVIAQYGDR